MPFPASLTFPGRVDQAVRLFALPLHSRTRYTLLVTCWKECDDRPKPGIAISLESVHAVCSTLPQYAPFGLCPGLPLQRRLSGCRENLVGICLGKVSQHVSMSSYGGCNASTIVHLMELWVGPWVQHEVLTHPGQCSLSRSRFSLQDKGSNITDADREYTRPSHQERGVNHVQTQLGTPRSGHGCARIPPAWTDSDG